MYVYVSNREFKFPEKYADVLSVEIISTLRLNII